MSRVIVLDHHKTALESLGSESSLGENVIKVIDMERSGATIAFDYFKEKLVSPADDGVVVNQPLVLDEFERVRQLFKYIEDGDLWRWRLQKSKAFSSGLKDLNIEFNARINPSVFDQVIVGNEIHAVENPYIRTFTESEPSDQAGLNFKTCLPFDFNENL